jgi:hypothetical protein
VVEVVHLAGTPVYLPFAAAPAAAHGGRAQAVAATDVAVRVASGAVRHVPPSDLDQAVGPSEARKPLAQCDLVARSVACDERRRAQNPVAEHDARRQLHGVNAAAGLRPRDRDREPDVRQEQ